MTDEATSLEAILGEADQLIRRRLVAHKRKKRPPQGRPGRAQVQGGNALMKGRGRYVHAGRITAGLIQRRSR